MFYLKQNKSFKNYIILSDFDRTLTTSDSPSSWDVLSTIGKFSSYYHQEVEKLHQKYRPIELDESLAINIKMNAMEKWWQSHIDLLIAQKFHKSDLKKINHNHLKLRNGVKEFLTKIAQLDIPIIIVFPLLTAPSQITLSKPFSLWHHFKRSFCLDESFSITIFITFFCFINVVKAKRANLFNHVKFVVC